jgi:hypothetical protein
MVKREWRLGVATAVALLGLLAPVSTASSQQMIAPGGAQRDCQTVRTCNFARNAAVRGCLSSYTCRTCKLVRSRCDIGADRYCQRIVCTWGG